jgi:hypothetical protein
VVCKASEVLNSTLFCPEIGRRSIIDVPQAPEILIASLYPECKRLAGHLELQPRQSFRASIEALAAFRLSPLAVQKDVDDKLLIFVSSLGTESPKVQEAVLELRRRLVAVTLVKLFDALLKKIQILVEVGDVTAKVCFSVPSPVLCDLS